MKKRATKAIALLLTFCITFSGLPLIFGSLDVNAASTTKKKITLKATVKGETKVKLKWNKVKSPGKGYAVFRDGKVIKRLSKKKTSFTDKGLKPGTKHKYQIKTYTKKKVTKWYNKKTKKWQKKKPAKKYRGKSKKVTSYKYKKKSNIVTIKTDTPKDETSEDTPKDETSEDTKKDEISGDTPKDEISGDTSKDDASEGTRKDEISEDASKKNDAAENDTPAADTDDAEEPAHEPLQVTLYEYVGSSRSNMNQYVNTGITTHVNNYLRIQTNNQIREVVFSDDRVAGISSRQKEQIHSSYVYSFILELYEIGSCTMTVTDIYGGSRTLDFVIENSMGMSKADYDSSLPVPVIDTFSKTEHVATLNVLWPDSFPNDTTYGFSAYASTDESFEEDVIVSSTDSQWNNAGYGKISWFYIEGSQYMKVRSYHVVGDTVYYGPWSRVVKAEELNRSDKKEGTAQYSYELYYLSGIDTYSNISRAVYLKTNNPDPNSIGVTIADKNIVSHESIMSKSRYYDDVEYKCLTDTDEGLQKVEGGYLALIKIEDPGQYTAEIREYSPEGYVTANKISIDVKDYYAEESVFIDRVIAENTNDSMNPKEKLEAVCAYLTSEEAGFRYLATNNGSKVTLLCAPGMPWFEVKRWDSASSPAKLQLFAKHIGGFDEIGGGDDWDSHAYMYAVYEGETKWYMVCPAFDSGAVDYTMFDFNDPKNLYPVK